MEFYGESSDCVCQSPLDGNAVLPSCFREMGAGLIATNHLNNLLMLICVITPRGNVVMCQVLFSVHTTVPSQSMVLQHRSP